MTQIALEQRIYEPLIARLSMDNSKTVLLSGPGGVGISSICTRLGAHLTEWSSLRIKGQFLEGPAAYCFRHEIDLLDRKSTKRMVALDGLLDDDDWDKVLSNARKQLLNMVTVVATGHMDVLQELLRSGISVTLTKMMPYSRVRIHPWTVGELGRFVTPLAPFELPIPIPEDEWSALLTHGGFPQPFRTRTATYSSRWRRTRKEDLVREFRRFNQVELKKGLMALIEELEHCSGKDLDYSVLAKMVGVSDMTIRRWVHILERLEFGFFVRPWKENVPRSHKKIIRWFLRDWSGIKDPVARVKTMVACHLLKAVQGWTDFGFGSFELFTIRDQRGHGIDFLVTKDEYPWFLVNVVRDGQSLPKSLEKFRNLVGAERAFQVVMNLPYTSDGCFAEDNAPSILVPAKTFLSQLP
jgi:hypothetical protein